MMLAVWVRLCIIAVCSIIYVKTLVAHEVSRVYAHPAGDGKKRILAEKIVDDFLKFDPEVSKIWKKVAADALYEIPEAKWESFISFVPRLFTNDMDGYQRALVISSFSRFPENVWDEASKNIPQFFGIGQTSDGKKIKKSTAFYNTLIISAFSKVSAEIWPGFIEYTQKVFEILNAVEYKHEVIKRIANVPVTKRDHVLTLVVRFLPQGLLEFARMRVLSGFCRPMPLINLQAFQMFLGDAFAIMRDIDLTNYGAAIDNLGGVAVSNRAKLLHFLKQNRLRDANILEWLIHKSPTQWDESLKNYKTFNRN